MSTYVGADARQSGKFQGELIADLPNKGDLNGDGVLQYVMVVGDPENVDAKYRTEFSISPGPCHCQELCRTAGRNVLHHSGRRPVHRSPADNIHRE